MALNQFQPTPSGVQYSGELEEILVAKSYGWETYHNASMEAKEAMIAEYRTMGTLDAVLVERAERQAEIKAKQARQAQR